MTDEALIELLARKGMGWDVHDVSAHRPGSRALPHAWRWRRAGGLRFMVYDGKTNREWNPLKVDADTDELRDALAVRGITATAATREEFRQTITAWATTQKEDPENEIVQG